MPDAPLVHLGIRGGTATITLDSPHNRNALSRALLAQLNDVLHAVNADTNVRVIVLTGSGPVFCSGADLKEQRAPGAAPTVGLPEILTAIIEGPLPVVARVNGGARAGGLGLIAACDLTVGLDDATFAFSEVRLGVAPAIIAVPCLRRMDPRGARELFLTGEPFDGVRAQTTGLLDRAVPGDELDVSVAAFVDQLSRGGPQALTATKRLLHELPGHSLDTDFRAMASVSAERFSSEEAQEGIGALLGRRTPSWTPATRP